MNLLYVLLFASPNGRIDTDAVHNRYHEVMDINNTVIKSICNSCFGKEKTMAVQTPFYVLIKTDGDEEIFPCADLETAEYCVNALKKYNFKSVELTILGEIKKEVHDETS